MNRTYIRFILIGLFSFSSLSPYAQVVALLHGSGLHNFESPSTLFFIDLANDRDLLSLSCPNGIASGGLIERTHDLLITSGWDDKKRKALGATITLFSLKNHEFTRSYSQDTLYHVHHFDSDGNVLYLLDWWKKLFVLNLNREQWTIEPSETPMANLAARIDSDHWIWANENQLMWASDFTGNNSNLIYTLPHTIRSLYCIGKSKDQFILNVHDTQNGNVSLLFSFPTFNLLQEIHLREKQGIIDFSPDPNTIYFLESQFDISNEKHIKKLGETNLKDGNEKILHTMVKDGRFFQCVYPTRVTRNNRFILLRLEYTKKTLPCQLFIYDLLTHQFRIKDIGPGRIHSLLELSEDAVNEFNAGHGLN